MTFSQQEKKFVPVMITPFDEQGKIDQNALVRLIDFYLAAGVKGFFANCLSSEMFSLTDEERLELVKCVMRHAGGDVTVVATGSFGKDLAHRADFIKKMHDTGVDAVIVITSHLARAEESDEVLLQNAEQLLRLTGNIPLGLYECPAPYKRLLSPRLFEQMIVSGRFVYHKDTSLDIDNVKAKLAAVSKTKGEPLEFYDAHSPHALASLRLGAKGLSAIAGNFYPEIMVWLCNHATTTEDSEQAAWIQSEIARTDPVIHDAYPVSAKYFLQKRGLPLLSRSRVWVYELSRGQREKLDRVYTDFLGWRRTLHLKTD